MLHFLVAGAALLAADASLNPPEPAADTQIVVPADIVTQLSDGWHQRAGSPPTDEEQKGLIDRYVEEEVLYREALRMGFAHGDLIVRRRMVQKMNFLLEDLSPPAPPSDAILQGWLDEHEETYRRPEQIAFAHRAFSRARHGVAATADAVAALAVLEQGGSVAGDPAMQRAEQSLRTLAQVSRDFGTPFADALAAHPEGAWVGPIASSYGQHLVFIHERVPGRAARLDEVRDAVRRDVLAAEEKGHREARVASLVSRYTVEVGR